MKSFVCAVALALGLMAMGAPASSAQAPGFTLNLSAPTTPVVGKPLVLQATGTIPIDDLEWLYWFSLDAIPTSVTTTCPADRWEGWQFAHGNGGTVVVLSQRVRPDAAGNFSIPVAITPSAPGSVILCGYTDDGYTNTLAGASLILDIAPAPSSGGDPRSTQGGDSPGSIPVEVARGIRLCRALFAPAKFRDCVRDLVKDAKAACRKQLPSRRGQARCLRRVRRVSRRYV